MINTLHEEPNAAYQLDLFEHQYTQQLTADDFSPMIADAEPYYAITYADRGRRSKGHPEASFFIVYRRLDGEPVHESCTYDLFETVNRAAADVVADFIENGDPDL